MNPTRDFWVAEVEIDAKDQSESKYLEKFGTPTSADCRLNNWPVSDKTDFDLVASKKI